MSCRAIAGALLLLGLTAAQADPLRVYGSSTTARAFQPAARAIFEDTGADLAFETSGGSTAAVRAVANGQVDIGMSTRSISQADRSLNPAFRIFDAEIGLQVLVPIVSKQTWDAGLKAVSKDTLIKLYEGDLKSWKDLGGPDVKPVFINPTDGRGVWEPFVTWLYGDLHRVGPGRRWQFAETNEQARDLVAQTVGSLSIVPPQWVDGRQIVALSVLEEKGEKLDPTTENFRSRKWPLVRPIVIFTGNRPTGLLRKVFEFMVGPKGQEFVAAAEFLPRPEAAEELAASLR